MSTEQPPLAIGRAAGATLRCALRTVVLLVGRRVLQPATHVGTILHFADQTCARVYRATVLRRGPARALWRILALVSVRGSVHYVVLPGLRRDELLTNPGTVADHSPAWWRLVEVEPPG